MRPKQQMVQYVSLSVSHSFLHNNPHLLVHDSKFHGPGVAFEVVCDPVSGRILWINGP